MFGSFGDSIKLQAKTYIGFFVWFFCVGFFFFFFFFLGLKERSDGPEPLCFTKYERRNRTDVLMEFVLRHQEH